MTAQKIMSKASFDLKTIDALIHHIESTGDLESSKLLRAVRSHYRSDKELQFIQSISSESILSSIAGNKKVPDGYLISLKNLVNATLTNLFNQKLASFHLCINHKNIFALSQSNPSPKITETRTPQGQAGFKTSEMIFNLPREIHEQFKVITENIKGQEGELSAQIEKLIAAENDLMIEKETAEKEKSQFRNEILSKFEEFSNNLDLSNVGLIDEISNLKKAVATLQEKYAKSINNYKFDADTLHNLRQKYELTARENKEKFEQLFNKATHLINATSSIEKEFAKRRSVEENQLIAKELRLEEKSKSLLRQQKELSTQARQLTIAKRNYKAQLDLEFMERVDVLNSKLKGGPNPIINLSSRESSIDELEESQIQDDHSTNMQLSLEKERANLDSELNDIQDKKYAEELIIQKKYELLLADETKKLEAIRKREEESINKLKDTQSLNSRLDILLQETNSFISEAREIYETNIATQKSDYQNSKLTIQELENESLKFCQMLRGNEKRNIENSIKTQQYLEKLLEEKLGFIESIEQNQKAKFLEYQNLIKENQKSSKIENLDNQNQRELMLKNLINHENRLLEIGDAFEELSKSFREETEKKKLIIVPEGAAPPIDYTEDMARLEWNQAVKQRIEKPNENQPLGLDICKNIFIGKLEEWVLLPSGTFTMNAYNGLKSTSFKNVILNKPVSIKKYPVTNLEYFQFVNATNYQTEAERGLTAIVYHPGAISGKIDSEILSIEKHPWPSFTPDENAYWLCPRGENEPVYDRLSHPVTQVTWNDAIAFCQWQSEITGKKIRLPTEIEWEYAFRNLGKSRTGEFPLDKNEIANYCNIEDTQKFDTTPVDEFSHHELTAGVQDMIGNVHEWVMDSLDFNPESTNSSRKRIARGGSYINSLEELPHCHRSLFSGEYCSGYIGFRIACESD